MRETMATTLLALTKEAGGIEREELLLVLEALFRPLVVARTDDGHFGGVLEVLAIDDIPGNIIDHPTPEAATEVFQRSAVASCDTASSRYSSLC